MKKSCKNIVNLEAKILEIWVCDKCKKDGQIIDAEPCFLKVNDADGTPVHCPFDMCTDADWKQITKEEFFNYL